MSDLSTLEQTRLGTCERVIERGLSSFKEVGEALLTIRDNRLYRATHGTFEDYCRERWGMTPRHANRLVGAYEVVDELGPMGPIPATERVARELVPLRDQPASMREVWQEVVDHHPPTEITAAAVRERVERIRAPQRPRTDVIGVMASVVSHADRAARAAEDIKRHHLASRAGDVQVWHDQLSRSLSELQRLLVLMEGITS